MGLSLHAGFVEGRLFPSSEELKLAKNHYKI